MKRERIKGVNDETVRTKGKGKERVREALFFCFCLPVSFTSESFFVCLWEFLPKHTVEIGNTGRTELTYHNSLMGHLQRRGKKRKLVTFGLGWVQEGNFEPFFFGIGESRVGGVEEIDGR